MKTIQKKLTKVTFSAREYERSHGKPPRGRGVWCFCPEWAWDMPSFLEMSFFAPPGTLAEAKRAAREHFGKMFISRVIVCP